MSTGAYIALFMVTGALAWIPDTTFGAALVWLAHADCVSGGDVLWSRVLPLPWIVFYIRSLRRKGSSPVIMAMSSLGAAFILRMLILIFWGADSLFYRPGILRPALQPSTGG